VRISESQRTRITRQGKVVWSMKVPAMHYPCEAFPAVDGKQVIVAKRKTTQIIWQYGQSGKKGPHRWFAERSGRRA
jgi:hypothetical protein